MIGQLLDSVISAVNPVWGVRRMQARRLIRSYAGAESNRLTNHSKPKNQSADAELLGPFGADSLRAWARKLVRDNSYAWGVVDTIVSSVVGCGISAQSMLETDSGSDIEDINWARDAVWQEWCEVCDLNGQFTFAELQRICQREIVEAGEVLIHFVPTGKSKEYRGISRPVPLALELIEADRLASDQDTYALARDGGKRIIRGVEIDDLGKPVAYYIYDQHPNGPYATLNRTPRRIDASEVLHLFRRDRIGQSRGVSWFAPVMSWLRDLGVYVDNEIQASAVAACFGVAIKTENAVTGLMGGTDDETTNDDGNTFEYLEPAMIARLKPGESIESINPGRPNSASEPWINLMLRGIAVGTGLSYETVARDYSKTNYSSSRTSQLEDRRRFRIWQQYLLNHLCQPVWDRFCEAAALAGNEAFPTMADLLENRRAAVPVEWQTPEWEWVDPQNEQAASKASIDAFQSTYQTELGQQGRNYRKVFYQAAKERKLLRELGLLTPEQEQNQTMVEQAQINSGTGEMKGMGRRDWLNNQKAVNDILQSFIAGALTDVQARIHLSALGLNEQNIADLLADARDGVVDGKAEEMEVAAGV